MADIDVKAILLDGELLGRSGEDLVSVPVEVTQSEVDALDGRVDALEAIGAAPARPFKFVTRNTGDITCNTPISTWQELAAESGGPGTGAFDLTLPAATGNVIQAAITCLTSTAATSLFFDVKTMVAGAATNSFIGQGAGTAVGPPYGPWYAQTSQNVALGAAVLYTVVAGDIAAGSVTFRPYVATGAATNRIVYAGGSYLFQFSVQNLGAPHA